MASNYNSYNPYNPYNPNFYNQEMKNLQNIKDNADQQIQNLQNMQQARQSFGNQQPQPQINQTFQLAPNQGNPISAMDTQFAENIDEVNKYIVLKPTLFTKKDYSFIWIKDANGNVRTFKTEEIIPVDESKQEINNLKQEIADIKALLIQQVQMQAPRVENPKPIEEPKQEKKVIKK